MSVIAWMVYALAVALLLAAGAWCLDRGLSRVGWPTRWVWVGALALSVALPAGGGFLGAGPGDGAANPDGNLGSEAGTLQAGTLPVRPAESRGTSAAAVSAIALWAADGAARLTRPFERAGARMGEGLGRGIERLGWSPASDRWALSFWLAGSAALVGVLLLSSMRMRRRRSGWSRARVAGRLVRISPDLGPAVVGCLRPDIVLPPWVADLEPEALELVLAHEEEHVHARDPLLLTGALLPLLLLPWNLPLWWQLRGLRAAVEVDCDRRVLRRGSAPRRYGALLVRLESRGRGSILPAPALSGPPSLLTRRLNAMKKRSVRSGFPSSLAASIAAVGLVLLACEAETPTVGVDDSADAAPAEAAGAPAGADASGDAPQAVVRAERMTISLGRDGEAVVAHAPDGREITLRMRRPEGSSRPTEIESRESARPLIVVDGVIVGTSAPDLESLEVTSIEVIRGAAAAGLYGSRASGGVINITTAESAARGDP